MLGGSRVLTSRSWLLAGRVSVMSPTRRKFPLVYMRNSNESKSPLLFKPAPWELPSWVRGSAPAKVQVVGSSTGNSPVGNLHRFVFTFQALPLLAGKS